jgi:hypothetical protein
MHDPDRGYSVRSQHLISMFLVVEVLNLNQLSTSSSLVALLAPFGRQSGLGTVPFLTVGQDQTSFLSVVEDNEYYFSSKLP